MVKVLIVDDERLAVKYYTQLINWQFYGFEIIGTAYDGHEALHILEEKETDLTITDIKMPVMDGIEFAKKARERNPDLHILFVTSYTDFDYTYNALKLGADDYIMKDTVEEKMFAEKLLEIERKIDAKKDENSYKIEKVLEEVFTGVEKSRLGWLGERGQKITEEQYYYLYIRQDRPIPAAASFFEAGSEEREESRMLVEVGKNFADEHFRPVSVFRYADGIVSILKAPAAGDAKMLAGYSQKLQSGLDLTAHGTFSVYTVSRPTTLSAAGRIFAGCRAAALVQIFLGRRLLMEVDSDRLRSGSVKEPFDAGFVESCIKTNDRATLLSYLTDFFEQTRKEQDAKAFDYALYHCLNCLKKFGQGLHDIKTGKMFSAELNRHEEDMMYTVPDAVQWVTEKFELLFSIREEVPSEKYSKDTFEIIKYIMGNYGRTDLDVDSLSSGAAMSTARPESKFKLETGLTLIDYLNKYRIQQAMGMLENGDVKIYEISEKVGFASSQYFSKVFKKYTALTPIEYRKRLTDEIFKKYSD